MSRVQLSLLGGSGQLDPGKRYRTARYDFGAGPSLPTEFFAAALLNRLQPDRLVILGTTGSMWDVLLESLVPGDDHHELLLELIDAAAQDRVTQQQLDSLAPKLESMLSAEVRLRLIPYGRTRAEQTTILQAMTQDIAPQDTVSLDVTHGLRHLPMLAQMGTLYLRKARQVSIEGIYYGALELTQDGVTPVMDLKGLLDIADWVGALHTFDKDGDYGVFRLLLAEALGEQEARGLEDAAFYERTIRPGQARSKLREVEKNLPRIDPDSVASLFANTLRERISWCHGNRLYQRQQLLARQYLAHGDFLRCAIFAFEAFITRLCQQQGISNTDNPEARRSVKEGYEAQAGARRPYTVEFRQYQSLRGLRNKLAHGDQASHSDEQRALASPEALRTALTECLDRLLPAADDA